MEKGCPKCGSTRFLGLDLASLSLTVTQYKDANGKIQYEDDPVNYLEGYETETTVCMKCKKCGYILPADGLAEYQDGIITLPDFKGVIIKVFINQED